MFIIFEKQAIGGVFISLFSVMLSKTERLAESVIKSVLEILRNHPDTEFSELQIEQGTREKIISRQPILERLRNNPKIQYDSVTGRYRFKPSYPIKNRTDLINFIQSRPTLIIDSDLLECYRAINDDISDILAEKKVRAIRQSDFDRTLKCEVQQDAIERLPPNIDGSKPPKPPKCSLYGEQRCTNCATNRGIVLMKRFEPEIESMHVGKNLRSFYESVRLPHISEIHRITESQSQHLLTTNTSQLISNKVTRKIRSGPGRQRTNPSGSKFSWSEVNANRVSNIHILPLLEGSSPPDQQLSHK
jgi:hypothetical protein